MHIFMHIYMSYAMLNNIYTHLDTYLYVIYYVKSYIYIYAHLNYIDSHGVESRGGGRTMEMLASKKTGEAAFSEYIRF
jgi:hypothetical protein